MKRRKLIKAINELAKKRGVTPEWSQGSNHLKVKIGAVQTTIPRHLEVNEITAKSILTFLERGIDD